MIIANNEHDCFFKRQEVFFFYYFCFSKFDVINLKKKKTKFLHAK